MGDRQSALVCHGRDPVTGQLTMLNKFIVQTAVAVAILSFAPAHAQRGVADAAAEVRAAETAFAKSMADRNPSAFASLIADEAVFFGGKGVARGKAAVVADWKRFFDGPAAPFSWAPAEVEVLPSGALGFTSGPVYDPKGQRIGTFNSVWQRQTDGSWKVVFDKGCPPCECGAK
jgi:ketosteroid isomerase-like protein